MLVLLYRYAAHVWINALYHGGAPLAQVLAMA